MLSPVKELHFGFHLIKGQEICMKTEISNSIFGQTKGLNVNATMENEGLLAVDWLHFVFF